MRATHRLFRGMLLGAALLGGCASAASPGGDGGGGGEDAAGMGGTDAAVIDAAPVGDGSIAAGPNTSRGFRFTGPSVMSSPSFIVTAGGPPVTAPPKARSQSFILTAPR